MTSTSTTGSGEWDGAGWRGLARTFMGQPLPLAGPPLFYAHPRRWRAGAGLACRARALPRLPTDARAYEGGGG